jgi:hypothetical protein
MEVKRLFVKMNLRMNFLRKLKMKLSLKLACKIKINAHKIINKSI